MHIRTIDVGGVVHYADFGGEGERTFVLVHGLGGSHLNWASVAPGLARHGRVIAPDLSGFGLSPWRPGSATVEANRALLGRFLRALCPHPVVLVGNSMGGMLSVLQAAAEPSSIEALVLVCPALLPAPPGSHDRAIASRFGLSLMPGVGELITYHNHQRTPPEQSVDQLMRLCMVDPGRIDPAVLAHHHALARQRHDMPWVVPAYLEAARSLFGLMVFQRMRVLDAFRRVQAPTLLLQGAHDRLVLLEQSREVAALCPRWTFDPLPDLGHVPMLEAPSLFIERVLRWGPPRHSREGSGGVTS